MDKKILIINEPNYKEVTDILTSKVSSFLKGKGIDTIVMTAPDISEIPTVLRYYIKSAELRVSDVRSMGYVILGCSEFTANRDGNMAVRDVMQQLNSMKIQYSLAMGIGLITPKDLKHALEWAPSEAINAAERVLQLLEIKKKLGL